jgi:predicted ATPase
MSTPRPRTRFVGRTGDLVRLAELCRTGASMATLWGPPGAGKTRLALELCARRDLVRSGRRPQTWFCDLSGARDLPEVFAAVWRALGARDGPLCTRWIATALAGRDPGVLVLDNMEQVAEHAAQTVGVWAEAAPDVFFLVTSRERLRLVGEVTHEVAPLGAEAVELFVDRAWGGAPPPAESADPAAIAELVARLEGIPLAIELAAARVDALGIDGLLAQLARPLDALGRAPRDAPPHHASLRCAIEGSWQLLGEREQRACAECAVFRGGFSLEAAEAVLSDGPALDLLEALRDRALLRRSSDGGLVRFSMFEVIRAHALEQLGDREGAARARHSDHFLRAAARLGGADQENLADAIAFALEAGGGSPELADALELLDPSLLSDRLVDLVGDAALGARGRRVRGRALQLRGRLDEARGELERAAASADDAMRGALLADLGVLHHQLRELDAATAAYEEASILHRNAGDRAAEARCTGNLGAIHHDARRYDEAIDHYQRALADFRATGQHRMEGIFLTNMAVLLQEQGAMARARATYRAALDRLAATGDHRLEAITRSNLGLLAHETGDAEEARCCHERALATLRDVVDVRSEALALGRLAIALADLGRLDEARASLRRAERLLAGTGDRVSLGVLGLYRAYVDLEDGAGEEFVRDRIDEARAPAFAASSSLLDLCDDARTAVRLIDARLAGAGCGEVLVVGPEAAWFTLPGGHTQDLASRRVLRRLLLRLVESHRAARGEGVSLEALREAGWPGETVLHAAAVNRVHVALTELRRRGLKPWLLHRQGRYLLDPSLRVDLGGRGHPDALTPRSGRARG